MHVSLNRPTERDEDDDFNVLFVVIKTCIVKGVIYLSKCCLTEATYSGLW